MSDEDRTICFCHNVPLSRLLGAIQDGSKTLADLQRETFASTGCGGCEFDLLEILETELAKNPKDSA